MSSHRPTYRIGNHVFYNNGAKCKYEPMRGKRTMPPSNIRLYFEFDKNFRATIDDGSEEIKD